MLTSKEKGEIPDRKTRGKNEEAEKRVRCKKETECKREKKRQKEGDMEGIGVGGQI